MLLFDHRIRATRAARHHQDFDGFLDRQVSERLAGRINDIGLPPGELTVIQPPWQDSDSKRGKKRPQRPWSDNGLLSLHIRPDGSEILECSTAALPAIAALMQLHWINDLPGLLIQTRRLLRPGGLFIAGFLGGNTLAELRDVMLRAEDSVRGGATARVSPFLDIRDAGALMARAGYSEPVADAEKLNCTYLSPLALMHDLRTMNETNALVSSYRQPLRRDVLFEACRLYHELYPAHDGRISATFEFIFVTGWAPDIKW